MDPTSTAINAAALKACDRIRGHKMLTKAIERDFAKIGSQEGSEDPIAVAKWFDACSRWTWYATEYDPETGICFGYVISGLGSDCDEWGYFSVVEIGTIRNSMGLPIERDCYREPGTFKGVRELKHQ